MMSHCNDRIPIASIGKILRRRTCIEQLLSAGACEAGMEEGRSRVRKCVRRLGTSVGRRLNQNSERRVRVAFRGDARERTC